MSSSSVASWRRGAASGPSALNGSPNRYRSSFAATSAGTVRSSTDRFRRLDQLRKPDELILGVVDAAGQANERKACSHRVIAAAFGRAAGPSSHHRFLSRSVARLLVERGSERAVVDLLARMRLLHGCQGVVRGHAPVPFPEFANGFGQVKAVTPFRHTRPSSDQRG